MRWIRLHFFDVGDDALRVEGLLSQKKKRNMVTGDSYNFLKRVSKHACKRYRLFFFIQDSQNALEAIDSHTYSVRSVLLQQVAVRIDRESAIPRSIGSIGWLDGYISSYEFHRSS